MEHFWTNLLTEQVFKIADEGIGGCKEIVCKFAGNYVKRRNVGFTVIESVSGSFSDTKRYYSDILVGKEPRDMNQAVEYDI